MAVPSRGPGKGEDGQRELHRLQYIKHVPFQIQGNNGPGSLSLLVAFGVRLQCWARGYPWASASMASFSATVYRFPVFFKSKSHLSESPSTTCHLSETSWLRMHTAPCGFPLEILLLSCQWAFICALNWFPWLTWVSQAGLTATSWNAGQAWHREGVMNELCGFPRKTGLHFSALSKDISPAVWFPSIFFHICLSLSLSLLSFLCSFVTALLVSVLFLPCRCRRKQMGGGFQMNTEYHTPIDEIILEFSKIILHGYMAREKISLGFWELGSCCLD